MQSTLYTGGTILTMEPQLCAQALLVEDSKILCLGRADELAALRPHARRVDLEGRTLMPGFIDAHSHFTAYASTLGLCDLSKAESFDEILALLGTYRASVRAPKGALITGFGYDHNHLLEKRHPDKRVLAALGEDNPVVIAHASGHMGVLNAPAMRMLNLRNDMPDPEGGKMGRMEDGSLSGYMEETAFTSLKLPGPSKEQLSRQMELAQAKYFSYGITTCQDGLTRKADWDLLQNMAQGGHLDIDLVSYIDIAQCADLASAHPEYRKYQNHLRIGGYKLILDGSPQGRTAWIKTFYQGQPGYSGYPVYEDGMVEGYIARALSEDMQILIHCNGDAAAEQMITCYERALNGRCKDARPVMIHAQLVNRSQLSHMGRLGIMASFFVAHTYYWGDVHIQNFGPRRAAQISPVQWAMESGVNYTFHQDAPVLPPDMIDTVRRAVERRTLSGEVLGEDQRITALQALYGVTRNAAYQYFEENEKGTLKPGKRADLVILSDNPLTCSPEKMGYIEVLETIKDGMSVYLKQ